MIENDDILKEKAEEIALRIGVRFQDVGLLIQAFTHTSYVNEQDGRASNERLEFLGDAVFGQIIACMLYRRFPDANEGELSSLRAHLVDAPSCVRYIEELGLAPYVLIGRGEQKNWDRGRGTILADLFEALIGALYLDQGFEKVKAFVSDRLQATLDRLLKDPPKNFKSLLQDYTQKKRGETPQYIVVSEEGPDHSKVFTVHVLIGGAVVGIGVGASKKQAEQEAAKEGVRHVDMR